MHIHIARIALLMIVIPLGESEAQSPQAAPSHASIPKELEGLRERWQKAMIDLNVPGMAVVVVRDDNVIYLENLGIRDPEKNLQVTPDTYFYIASCTKTFNAMALLTLVEEGKIKLDAPVKTILPRFQIADAGLTESITIRDLLSHAKGVNSDPAVFLDAFTGQITEDRYYRWLRDAKASGSFQYSNIHYTLLGRIIETVIGKSWKDFLTERILRPAGLHRTTCYAGKMYADPDSAVPSDIHGDKCVHAAVTKSDRTMHAAGGMGSTANDLARWMRLNLSGGIIDGVRIVSEESIKAMQTMQAKAPEIKKRAAGRTREGYGFGWNIGAFRGRKTLDHGGGYVGTSAQITLLPDQKIGIAVLCNASGDLPEMVATEVAARLLGETIEDPLPRLAKQVKQRRERLKDETAEHDENPLDAKTLTLGSPAPYAGRYENADLGTIVIEVQDGRLKGTMGDLPLKFRSTGNDYFRTDTGSSQDLNGRFLSDDQKVVVGISMDVPEAGEVLFKRQAQ